ncbi:MAG TPA: hypothetical protein DCM64_08340 [Gammaproteobacteria bacterium]|jgi:hypothetical protein|nr:hypothetical protein [Gammaproteobacteria bacterium]
MHTIFNRLDLYGIHLWLGMRQSFAGLAKIGYAIAQLAACRSIVLQGFTENWASLTTSFYLIVP